MCCNCCKKGAPGPIGYGFLVSNGAPVNPPTDNRIYYLDLDTGDIYEWDGAAWQLIGTLGGGAPINKTYTIVAPNDEADNINLEYTFAVAAGSSGDTTFFADRVGCDQDITITINSVDGVTFPGGGTSVIIPSDDSIIVTEFDFSAILVPGTYNFTFEWSGCTVNRTQNVTLILT